MAIEAERTGPTAAMAALVAASLGVAPAFLVACQDTSSGTLGSVSARIGPEGGSLVASDGTRVDVPAGALPGVATLTLQQASDAPVPTGAMFVATPWTLEPEWLPFAQPITVTFPIDGGAKGLVVATSAQGDAGYLALAAEEPDPTHVATHTTHFATGAPVRAACPVTCAGSIGAGATAVTCTTTCLGHAYLLSCAGPPGSTPCSCFIDGVVTGAVRLDTSDAGVAASAYATACEFPASALSTSVSTTSDAGPD